MRSKRQTSQSFESWRNSSYLPLRLPCVICSSRDHAQNLSSVSATVMMSMNLHCGFEEHLLNLQFHVLSPKSGRLSDINAKLQSLFKKSCFELIEADLNKSW